MNNQVEGRITITILYPALMVDHEDRGGKRIVTAARACGCTRRGVAIAVEPLQALAKRTNLSSCRASVLC